MIEATEQLAYVQECTVYAGGPEVRRVTEERARAHLTDTIRKVRARIEAEVQA